MTKLTLLLRRSRIQRRLSAHAASRPSSPTVRRTPCRRPGSLRMPAVAASDAFRIYGGFLTLSARTVADSNACFGLSAADGRRRLCARKWSLFVLSKWIDRLHGVSSHTQRAPAECAVKTVELFSPRFRRMAEHVALGWEYERDASTPSRASARGPTSATVAYSNSPSDSVCRRCSYSRLARSAFSMSIRRCSASCSNSRLCWAVRLAISSLCRTSAGRGRCASFSMPRSAARALWASSGER